MIEIKFSRQQLTELDKERYARILKKVITQMSNLNKSASLPKKIIFTELKIIFM